MWNDSEFNSTFASPGGVASKEVKKNQIRHVLPVTGETINLCEQIEGENSVFDYNHLKFHHVSMVGIIRTVIKRSNDITYVLDDMTSNEFTVKLQSDENDELEDEENRAPQSHFVENQYVKVFGILKSLQGQKYIQAFRILPLKQLNEITYHILDCINTSIFYASKGQDKAYSANDTTHGNQPANANNNFEMEKSQAGGLSGIYNQISSVIKQSKSNEGIHIGDICAYFKNIPQNKIREALDFLSTEGHIYSTIDDEHFKSTDAI